MEGWCAQALLSYTPNPPSSPPAAHDGTAARGRSAAACAANDPHSPPRSRADPRSQLPAAVHTMRSTRPRLLRPPRRPLPHARRPPPHLHSTSAPRRRAATLPRPRLPPPRRVAPPRCRPSRNAAAAVIGSSPAHLPPTLTPRHRSTLRHRSHPHAPQHLPRHPRRHPRGLRRPSRPSRPQLHPRRQQFRPQRHPPHPPSLHP